MKIPLRSLKILLDQKIPPSYYKYASDVLLGLMTCTPPHGKFYGAHNPSVFQHVGIKSLVTPRAGCVGWGRVAVSFPGTSFDAMSLL